MLSDIHLYQIIVVAISSIMLFQGIKDFLNRETGQTFLKLFVRLIIWGGMGLVAVYPDFTMLLAKIIGIEGNINAVMLTGFLFLFLIIFKLLSAIEKIEQNITEINRKRSLDDAQADIEKMKHKLLKERKVQSKC